MAERMKRAMAQLALAPDVEPPDIVRGQLLAVLPGADEVILEEWMMFPAALPLPFLLPAECFLQFRSEVDHPDGPYGLGSCLEDGASVFIVESAGHLETHGIEADMVPPEGQALADTEAGAVGNHAGDIQLHARMKMFEYFFDIRSCKNTWSFRRLIVPGNPHVGHGVKHEPPSVGNEPPKRPMKDGTEDLESPLGISLFLLIHPILDEGRGHILQGDTPESLLQVVIHDDPVLVYRIGFEIHFYVLL